MFLLSNNANSNPVIYNDIYLLLERFVGKFYEIFFLEIITEFTDTRIFESVFYSSILYLIFLLEKKRKSS